MRHPTWCRRACSKRSRSWRSASPTHLDRQSAPLRMKKDMRWPLLLHALASARACGKSGVRTSSGGSHRRQEGRHRRASSSTKNNHLEAGRQEGTLARYRMLLFRNMLVEE